MIKLHVLVLSWGTSLNLFFFFLLVIRLCRPLMSVQPHITSRERDKVSVQGGWVGLCGLLPECRRCSFLSVFLEGLRKWHFTKAKMEKGKENTCFEQPNDMEHQKDTCIRSRNNNQPYMLDEDGLDYSKLICNTSPDQWPLQGPLHCKFNGAADLKSKLNSCSSVHLPRLLPCLYFLFALHCGRGRSCELWCTLNVTLCRAL